MTDLGETPAFFDLVSNVRAMRRLKSDPVPRDLLMKVLNAGVQAPSGMNTQPWKFVVIEDPERKRWFAERYGQAIESRMPAMPADPAKRADEPVHPMISAMFYQMDHMHEAPYLVLVCGERDWPFKVAQEGRVGLAPPNFGAVYPCVQNVLLACRAVGLGAALTTMHQCFEEELHAYFGIPDTFGVVVTIPIGWPMGNFGSVTRIPAEEKTFFDRWEDESASE
jgi:nitroreductase